MADELAALGHAQDCVSRAYYSMFHAATGLLLTLDVRRKSHHGVVSSFGEHFVKTGLMDKELHHMFREVHELRGLSDYTTDPVDMEFAHSVLTKAQVFVRACRDFLG